MTMNLNQDMGQLAILVPDGLHLEVFGIAVLTAEDLSHCLTDVDHLRDGFANYFSVGELRESEK
jgi:hypothetical protein